MSTKDALVGRVGRLSIPERMHEARWNSSTPIADLRALAAELALAGRSLDLGARLALAEIVVDLHDVDRVRETVGLLSDFQDNEWARQFSAELLRIAGDGEAVDSLIAREAITLPALDVGMQRRWLRLAARRGPELLGPVVSALTDSPALDGTVAELDLGDPVPATRRESFSRVLATRPRMSLSRARATVDVLVDRAAEGARFRSNCVDWASFDTYSAVLVEHIVDDALAAADERRGYCAIRLGDGESQVLAGVMADLIGALGVDGGGDWNELAEPEYAAFRDRLGDAIAAADVVGVPDISQSLTGPECYGEVTAQFLEYGASTRALLPGGCDLGWALEISGQIDRLIARCTGIIGPINPSDLRRVPRSAPVEWLQVPGELRFYPESSGIETSHWGKFESIVEHDFRAGQVWLVGAGILGKVYCAAIKRSGGVAIDIGSVMDVWAGRQDTRGTVRGQLWVAAPYVDDPRGDDVVGRVDSTLPDFA